MADPITITIDDAAQRSGLGRTKIYELITAGKLDARKSGSRTLIIGDSLQAYLTSLPKANIRMAARIVTKSR